MDRHKQQLNHPQVQSMINVVIQKTKEKKQKLRTLKKIGQNFETKTKQLLDNLKAHEMNPNSGTNS